VVFIVVLVGIGYLAWRVGDSAERPNRPAHVGAAPASN
jgi:hypothetical protein